MSQLQRWGRRRPIPLIALLALIGVLFTAAPASAATKQFSFTFVNGTTIDGASDQNTAFLPNAGGTDANNPTGMDIHVSCSDKFEGGFGQKDGPDSVADSAWQIDSYTISEAGKGVKCSGNFGPPPPPPEPEIDIIKTVNGEDANTPTGPRVTVGDTVTLGYKVTNTGNLALSEVEVTDLDLGPIACPKTTLAIDEMMTCSEAQVKVTEPGQHFMKARVDAVGSINQAPTPPSADGKDKGFAFVFVNGTTISGTSKDNTVFLPNAGGTDPDNPIGMEVHVSCSDKFSGGFGEKDGPDRAVDSAWQIASFSIVKDGGKKTCGEVFQPVKIPVMDMDPVHFIADPPDPPLEPPVCSIRVLPDGMSVKVSWDQADGAVQYAVKRNNTFLSRTSALMFTDNNPPKGQKLEYFVRSIGTDSKTPFVSCGKVMIPDDPPPVDPPVCSIRVINDGDAVKVSWDQADGAVQYAVKRNGTFLSRTSALMFTDSNPPKNQTLEYFVRSIGKDSKTAYVSCGKVKIPKDPPPVDPPPICSVDFVNGQLKVSWVGVPDAIAYQVRADGKWQVRTTELMYVDPTPGTNYTVEAVYPGNVKSSRTPCIGTS